ncbi:MAG: NUDIX domain-containing protein [Acidobacteria bacterium]|nr:NUDIX domain-containing protein [Acidobacteriota bacterium]
MAEEPRYRQAVRAVILSHETDVLLVRFDLPGWAGWALPGGGVEPGEDDLTAIRRELAEEVGLYDPEPQGPIWERKHLFADPINFDGQAERIYLVKCATFDPTPAFSWDELRGEGVVEARWWTLDQLRTAKEAFAPSELPALLTALQRDGAPETALSIGY